jgi:hypothetical protein
MQILQLDSSILGDASNSRALSSAMAAAHADVPSVVSQTVAA